MDRDRTFAQVVGRAPTANEKAYLQRLGGAWDISGNDALLALLFVFSRSAARYHTYGARCTESVRRTVQRHLEGPGQRAAQPRPDGRLEITVTRLAAGLGLIALVGVAGLALGVSTSFRLSVPAAVLPFVTIRCGWALFGTMLLPASQGALWGWSLARAGARHQRVAGWATLTAVNVALGGWVVLLLTL